MATQGVQCSHGTIMIRGYESSSCLACRAEKAEARVAELEDALRYCLVEAKQKNGWHKAVTDRASAALREGTYARLDERIAKIDAADSVGAERGE